MALTNAQRTTLAAAIRAETDPSVTAALAIRDDVTLENWVNANSTVDAWNEAMTAADLFVAMDVTKFDALTAGKRDAWKLMMDYAPINLRKNEYRKAVVDVWGTVDSVLVLQACVRKATNGEKYLGGTTVVENTVSALKLSNPGRISRDDVSIALNKNP